MRAIAKGQPVKQFGQTIGFATTDVTAGQWVHTHNVEAGALSLDDAHATETPLPPAPLTGLTFPSYRRPDGRAATRNYVGVVSTVNCSAHTSKYIARHFDERFLADFPNVDGVVPVLHKGGCAMQYGCEDHLPKRWAAKSSTRSWRSRASRKRRAKRLGGRGRVFEPSDSRRSRYALNNSR